MAVATKEELHVCGGADQDGASRLEVCEQLQQYKMGRVVTGLKHCKPGLKKHCKPRVKTGLDKKNDLNQIKKQTSEN